MNEWYLVRYGDNLERFWVFEDREVALAWIARNGGHELDPAALLGPAAEPVDCRPVTYADLPPGDMVQLGNDLFRAYLARRADEERVDWPERDVAGDEEC